MKNILIGSVIWIILLHLAQPIMVNALEEKKYSLNNSNIKIIHTPFWLGANKNKVKDKQLCKINSIFKYYNFKWELITYYPEGCQNKNNEIKSFFEDSMSEQPKVENKILEKKSDLKEESKFEVENEGIDEFLWDLFGENSEENSEGNGEIEDLLGDIFSLKTIKLISTLRDFSKSKLKVQVWSIETNFIKGNNSYNETMAMLLNKIDREFNIDSIKNDFAKNINMLSYTFSTYNKTTDKEIKKVFKNKLKTDIKKLKKKYKVLKFKDRVITKFLNKKKTI